MDTELPYTHCLETELFVRHACSGKPEECPEGRWKLYSKVRKISQVVWFCRIKQWQLQRVRNLGFLGSEDKHWEKTNGQVHLSKDIGREWLPYELLIGQEG